jgi:hypothetical protein
MFLRRNFRTRLKVPSAAAPIYLASCIGNMVEATGPSYQLAAVASFEHSMCCTRPLSLINNGISLTRYIHLPWVCTLSRLRFWSNASCVESGAACLRPVWYTQPCMAAALPMHARKIGMPLGGFRLLVLRHAQTYKGLGASDCKTELSRRNMLAHFRYRSDGPTHACR